MSSSSAPAEPAARAAAGERFAWGLQSALVVAYLVLAHVASVGGDSRFAALALLAIVLLVLAPALLRARPLAWLALALAAAALWRAPAPHLWMPLRLVPVVFVAFVAIGFGRTLRHGRVPLVTRIVAALDGTTPAALPMALQAYGLALTRAWMWLLGALAAFDLWMALRATPAQWSWLANIGDYVVLLGFMLGEFAWRQHRFPDRDRSFLGFLRGMVALGPRFWRSVSAP